MSSPPPLASSHGRDGRWFPYRNAGEFDTNLAMILVILICTLAAVLAFNAAVRCFLRRRRRSGDSGPLPEVKGAELAVASAVPTMVFSAGMELAGADAECAICLSEFVNGEKVRVLPTCKHGFHDKCIEGWLSSKPSCPTCRGSYLSPSSNAPAGESGTVNPPEAAMAEP